MRRLCSLGCGSCWRLRVRRSVLLVRGAGRGRDVGHVDSELGRYGESQGAKARKTKGGPCVGDKRRGAFEDALRLFFSETKGSFIRFLL